MNCEIYCCWVIKACYWVLVGGWLYCIYWFCLVLGEAKSIVVAFEASWLSRPRWNWLICDGEPHCFFWAGVDKSRGIWVMLLWPLSYFWAFLTPWPGVELAPAPEASRGSVATTRYVLGHSAARRPGWNWFGYLVSIWVAVGVQGSWWLEGGTRSCILWLGNLINCVALLGSSLLWFICLNAYGLLLYLASHALVGLYAIREYCHCKLFSNRFTYQYFYSTSVVDPCLNEHFADDNRAT